MTENTMAKKKPDKKTNNEMPVPSQGHYGVHSFPVVDWFVCLYTYEFWLSLCKIVRSSVILLLPLFTKQYTES